MLINFLLTINGTHTHTRNAHAFPYAPPAICCRLLLAIPLISQGVSSRLVFMNHTTARRQASFLASRAFAFTARTHYFAYLRESIKLRQPYTIQSFSTSAEVPIYKSTGASISCNTHISKVNNNNAGKPTATSGKKHIHLIGAAEATIYFTLREKCRRSRGSAFRISYPKLCAMIVHVCCLKRVVDYKSYHVTYEHKLKKKLSIPHSIRI